MRIAVTGGAGYVGSQTCKLLAAQGHELLIFDNLSRGSQRLLKWGKFVEADLATTALLAGEMIQFRPEVVIHFAAFAYVGESISDPEIYYRNNVSGSLSLLQAMRLAGVSRIVVSSSCATYGSPHALLIDEDTPQAPINPYGRSKLMMEQMCWDFASAYGINCVALRYFNAAGCDPEGEIGEIHDPEPHLIPRAMMASRGEIPALVIHGNDYDTPDGTCIRDYIHVCDLAEAHSLAVDYLIQGNRSGAFNLGTGIGFSVLEVMNAVKAETGEQVPFEFGPRRPGDPAILVASADKARRVLGWKPSYSDIKTIIKTAWSWSSQL